MMRAIRPMAAAVLLSGLSVGGCAPLLPMLVASALGDLGGKGGAGTGLAGLGGPLAGTPSSVQNGLPADTSVGKALAMADEPVRETCRAKLQPQPEAAGSESCAFRSICLPGMDQPLTMRVCSRDESEAAAPTLVRQTAGWRWDAAADR